MSLKDPDNHDAKATVFVDGNIVEYHVELENGREAWVFNDFDKVCRPKSQTTYSESYYFESIQSSISTTRG